MGFSLTHLIAQPIGWGARAVGGIQNALPGQGDSSLNQVGRAITSGTATLSNPSGLFTSAPAFTEGAPRSVPNNTAPSSGGGGGGGGSVLGANTSLGYGYGGSGSGYVDPMIAQRTSWLNMFPGAVSNITQSGRDAFGSAGRSLQGGAESLFNTIRQGQKAIDTSRENVELNRLNGVKDILSFVRNGLRQGGARLAVNNAGESSAVGELGRAYGDIGAGRMRNVGNQAFLQNRDLDTQQGNLDLQRGQGVTDIHRQRDEAVATIGSQVRQQLADLDAQGQGLGITGKVAIDQEKQKVIDAGMAQLNNVDAWLQGQLAGVSPEAQDRVKTAAVALQQGGTSNVTPFDFGTFAGQQLQGPAVNQLPIFTRNRRADETA